MIRRLLKWTGGILVTTLLLLCLSITWLLATESGARWLLAKASPRLPNALQIDEVHGTLLGGLNFRTVSWRDTAATVTVAELDTELELMPLLNREVRINTLDIRDVDISVAENKASNSDAAPFSVDVPITLQVQAASLTNTKLSIGGNEITIDTTRVSGELSGSSLQIDRFDLHSALGDISLSGEAELSGSFPATANAAWDLRLQDQPPLSGVLKLQGDSSRYEVQHNLDTPYEIETTGTFAIVDSKFSVDLANAWQRLRVAAGDAPAVELVDGQLHVTGTVGEFAFVGATAVELEDIPSIAVETNGKLVADRIDFESLSVSNDWGRLIADGELLLSPEPSWTFNLELADLDPAAADARLSGKLQVTAKTAGRLVQQQPLLDLKIDRISGDLNGYPVEGGGVLSFAHKQLQFDNAIVRVGDNRVDFDGSYGLELQIDAKVRFADIGQFGLGTAGVLNGDVRLATDLEAFQAFGDVSGENLAWGKYAVDALEAEFNLPATGDGTIVLQLASAEQGNLAAEIDGRFVNRQWSGTVKKLTLLRDPVGEWALREAADFSLSQSQFDLGNFCLVTTAIESALCGAVNYEFSGPLQFEATVDAVPLAALTPDLPEGATVLGDFSARASGKFANGRLNADVGMRVDGLGLIATFEGDEVSANFEKATATANVVDNTLAAEFEFRLENSVDHAVGSVEITDLFDRQSALRGQGSLEFNDLALLSFFSPDLANPVGKIFGHLDASGSLMAPEIVGEVGLSDGSVDIRRAGISITEVDIVLRQSKAGELALQGSAKSGDGYLSLTGETSLGAETGIRTDIRLGGENFTLVRLPDMQATASPDIAVLFDERQIRVTGQLAIPEANITVQTVPESAQKPSPDAVVHRGAESVKAPQRTLIVDVTTKLGERVFFSGFGLTTGLDGSVRISGDSSSPYRGLGRVVLREGRYRAYGQSLEIESGELVFNGPLTNPSLNVRATRTASDKTVAGIHLTGTPSALRSDVYSEPALGDAEALSYLLTGRPLANANSAEGDMLNQAAFALGLTGAGNVASRIRNELGLDTLGVQGGSENRQLVAGKQLGNRLFVEYAYGMIDSLGTLLLRYQLNKRIVVESRSGSARVVDVVYSVKKP